MSCCLKIDYTISGVSGTEQIYIAGTYNSNNYFEFDAGGKTWYIWWQYTSAPLGQWMITDILGQFSSPAIPVAGTKEEMETDCAPQGVIGVLPWQSGPDLPFTYIEISECEFLCGQEDRTKKSYDSIKLPKDFSEQSRGIKDCCCKFLVLADTGGDSFKTDITSAWIKVSNPSDTFVFRLYKNGVLTTYTPQSDTFPNQNDAHYTTIHWADVLTSDGVGCYELKVTYSISGITGTLLWGQYDLQQYSIQNALGTARVKAKFNSYQEIEQIDFTGANVESTFRFFGFIGNRQPNTETDNIIYNNREMKSVIRENLNTYEIETEPTDECITRPLIDLYLLSENELYISDYNAHNHSYRYEDIPVIVGESPKLEYYELSRKAMLTCKVEDKFKNKRTYY